jgi:hypothetical protein
MALFSDLSCKDNITQLGAQRNVHSKKKKKKAAIASKVFSVYTCVECDVHFLSLSEMRSRDTSLSPGQIFLAN